MAVLAKTGAFWKTVKQISVATIGREAERPVRIYIVGDEGGREDATRRLLGTYTVNENTEEETELYFFLSTDPEHGFPQEIGADSIVIDLGGGLAAKDAPPSYFSIAELGGWDRALDRLLDMRPDLWLALGRRFPGLRRRVADRITHETAVANAEFAMLNALPGVIPIIAPLLPATAIGDIFLITKNQTMMMYRLAAAHGLPLDLRARSRDLAPLLGNAFGWRAIARELVAVVPGGIGLAARGAIAYAGTSALGKGLAALYQTGKPLTAAQINRLYKEAYAGAKRIAAERLRVLRGTRPVVERREPPEPDRREIESRQTEEIERQSKESL